MLIHSLFNLCHTLVCIYKCRKETAMYHIHAVIVHNFHAVSISQLYEGE